MTPADLLEQALAYLAFHLHPEWGDRTPLDVFNRLLAKNMRDKPQRTDCTHLAIVPSQIAARLEYRTAAELSALVRHNSPHRGDFSAPLVLAVYQGIERLLDGNHRVNYRLLTHDQTPLSIIVLDVTGEAAFVEHAPA